MADIGEKIFSEDKNVAAAQKVMLEILVEIHRICVENDITYWLEAGTLLGAIRHKGFIPWDDDCDVSMPRKDYERFLQIAQEKLPETMFLQTKETDKEYPLPWANSTYVIWGVLLNALVVGWESVSAQTIAGCVCVLTGVILVSLTSGEVEDV